MKWFKITLFLLLLPFILRAQSVGIGTDAPNENVVLHVQDPLFQKGMLVPFAFDTSMVNKVEGALIYYTKDQRFYFCTRENEWEPVGLDIHFDIFHNTFVGDSAIINLPVIGEKPRDNTAMGYRALKELNDPDGYQNTAVGKDSQMSNRSGSNNTSFGASSLYSNDSTHQNTAIGFQSMGQFTSGENGNKFTYNTSVGSNAMAGITKGQFNTAIGGLSMNQFPPTNIEISRNTAIGYNALAYNVGSNNIAIGNEAGADYLGNNPSSNSLFIDIDNLGSNSLIYGRFNDNFLAFNGNVQIKNTLNISTDGIKFTNNEEVNKATPVQYGIVASSSINFFGIIGEIKMFAKGMMLPPGVLPCDGSILPISGNEPLFEVIDTNYGGNGTDNFGLPDLRDGIAKGQQ